MTQKQARDLIERAGKRRAAPGWKGQRRKSDHGKRVEKTGKTEMILKIDL